MNDVGTTQGRKEIKKDAVFKTPENQRFSARVTLIFCHECTDFFLSENIDGNYKTVYNFIADKILAP